MGDTQHPASTARDHGGYWPSPGRAWYTVAIFNLALVFSFIDRSILSLLVGPIKRDLGISDTSMSLLLGFAFAMFYVMVGIPIGRLADVKSRRLIIGSGIALWSGMTALCGMAHNYWQLFAARVGVGVGEACLSPPAFSMLSDMFPRHKLPLATSVFAFGSSIGAGLALLVGGLVIQAVSSTPEYQLPVIGRIYSWQLTFFIVGVPGLAVAVLMRSVREPPRRGLLGGPAAAGGTRPLPVSAVARFILRDWRTYIPIYLALSLQSLQVFGTASWVPTFFIRSYGWSETRIGLALGIIMMVVGSFGMVSGGLLATWLARRGRPDANMRVVWLASLVVLPAAVLYPLMPAPWMALVLYAVNVFFVSMGPGPGAAALQTITPNQMRAQVMAVYYLILSLLGYGIGPTLVALFTDYVFHSEAMLPLSLSMVALTMSPLFILITWYGLAPYGASVARSGDWDREPLTV